MDANTNLVGTNPAAARVAALELNHYPSPVSADLCAAIARHHGLGPENVIVGNGSDEIIDFVTKAFVNPGDVVAVPSPTFVMYPFYARVNLARLAEVPLKRPGFGLDVDGLLRVKAKLLFVASPNNPTANAFSRESLESLLLASPGIVVIDEAYADFCGQDMAARVREHENLLVLRTFSKAHGLAGLRVGYALGNRELIDRLYCVKPPFTVGALPEAIAIEALKDLSFLRECVRVIAAERERISRAVKTERSDANFLLIEVGDGRRAREHLYSRRILTRDMGDFPGMGAYLRATIGRPEHNDRLLEALREWKP
jgi:histidinol-phosphate aminotransferase